MDAMLIIIAVAMFLLTVVMNVVVMIHFSDEADKNQAWLPKLVVVSSHGVAGAAGGGVAEDGQPWGAWGARGAVGPARLRRPGHLAGGPRGAKIPRAASQGWAGSHSYVPLIRAAAAKRRGRYHLAAQLRDEPLQLGRHKERVVALLRQLLPPLAARLGLGLRLGLRLGLGVWVGLRLGHGQGLGQDGRR